MYDEEAMIRDGIVTREMINRAKAKISSLSDMWLWPEFLPEVRAEMKREQRQRDDG